MTTGPRLPPAAPLGASADGSRSLHLVWLRASPHGAHLGARRHRELGHHQPARVGEPGHALAGAGVGAGVKPDRRTGCAEVRQAEPVVRRKLAWWAGDWALGTPGHQAETGSPAIHSRSLGPGTPSSRSCLGLGCKREDAHPRPPYTNVSATLEERPGAVTR